VNAPVQSARLSTDYIKQGQDTIFVGFNQNFRIVVAKTAVTDITTVSIPANASAPRYRAINLDAITVDTGLSGQCTNGVLVGEDGVVQALWLNYLGERTPSSHKDVEYHLGFATPSLLPVTSKIQQGVTPKLRILNMESYVVQMSQARIMGVSEEWIQKVAQANPSRHQLFMVRKVDCPPANFTATERIDSFQEADIILTLDGQLIPPSADDGFTYVIGTHQATPATVGNLFKDTQYGKGGNNKEKWTQVKKCPPPGGVDCEFKKFTCSGIKHCQNTTAILQDGYAHMEVTGNILGQIEAERDRRHSHHPVEPVYPPQYNYCTARTVVSAALRTFPG
jgi:AraC-like DNA-binding protein